MLRITPETQDLPTNPCLLCGARPKIPALWTNDSGDHSREAVIACGCRAQVSIPLGDRYIPKEGDTLWHVIYGEWNTSLREASEKWNSLHPFKLMSGDITRDEIGAAALQRNGANWERAIKAFLIERYGEVEAGLLECRKAGYFLIDARGERTFYWHGEPVLTCEGYPYFKVKRLC